MDFPCHNLFFTVSNSVFAESLSLSLSRDCSMLVSDHGLRAQTMSWETNSYRNRIVLCEHLSCEHPHLGVMQRECDPQKWRNRFIDFSYECFIDFERFRQISPTHKKRKKMHSTLSFSIWRKKKKMSNAMQEGAVSSLRIHLWKIPRLQRLS